MKSAVFLYCLLYTSYYEEFVKNGFRILDIRQKERTEGLFREILSINRKRELTTEVRTGGLIGTLLTELIARNTTEGRQAILIPSGIRAAEKYLEQHFREKVMLQELADMQGEAGRPQQWQ